MLGKAKLEKILDRLDGQSYTRYKDLTGEYDFDNYLMYIDYIQGDPFAPPSKIRVRVSQSAAKFNEHLFNTKSRRIALEDFLAREVKKAITSINKGRRGTGKGGQIFIDSGGQEIIERTAVVVNKDYVEARISVGLPAKGRRILSKVAKAIFFDELALIVKKSLFYKAVNPQTLEYFVNLVEDQEYLREQLKEQELVAFIANDSILPRESGISNKPLISDKVIPFKAPESMQVKFRLPNRGEVTGMGIKAGITLIVGGGYHGKSTLLKAIERGVYNHIPGDGRELVITRKDAVKIRAEDGRYISNVDISSFINKLPFGQDTVSFSTDDASGSTSQAANIAEALEANTDLLLIDEDTSATNFMIRDKRMQELVKKDKEPITPFIDKASQLWNELKVSTILVVGGVGDYLSIANKVIMMDEYNAIDVTSKALEISKKYKDMRVPEGGNSFGTVKNRSPKYPRILKKDKTKVDAKNMTTLQINKSTILLNNVEQLVDISQTRAIGHILLYSLNKYYSDRQNKSISSIIERVYQDIEEKGLESISPFKIGHPGELAVPRKQEVAAAINRWREVQFM